MSLNLGRWKEMKWIVGHTKVVVVSSTRVDYCPRGISFVCTKQQNKSKLCTTLLAELCSSFMLCSTVEKKESATNLDFLPFYFYFFFSVSDKGLTAKTQNMANYQEQHLIFVSIKPTNISL